nr:hypothetical protein [Actinomycetota bacterium]
MSDTEHSDDTPIEAAVVHLARWGATAKADAAADSRIHERWAQTQAEDEATLASALL